MSKRYPTDVCDVCKIYIGHWMPQNVMHITLDWTTWRPHRFHPNFACGPRGDKMGFSITKIMLMGLVEIGRVDTCGKKVKFISCYDSSTAYENKKLLHVYII